MTPVEGNPEGQEGRNPNPGRDFSQLAMISTIVGEMTVPVIVGTQLDQRLGWYPWATAVGAFLGVGGAFAHLILITRKKS